MSQPDLIDSRLHSRTMILYSSSPQVDGRFTFKIDHEFDFGKLHYAGPISRRTGEYDVFNFDNKDYDAYAESKGTEFVFIRQDDILNTGSNYAIRRDKYELIRGGLDENKIDVEDLHSAGGFELSATLSKEDLLCHDGWLDLATGINQSEGYEVGLVTLQKYTDMFWDADIAQYKISDETEKGMAFSIEEPGYLDSMNKSYAIPVQIKGAFHFNSSVLAKDRYASDRMSPELLFRKP
ncbi:MAG: hypothetical protein KKF44_08090 [Nanoarchaeota archaeon]|nr:hypothetical protein [Nanoarchaeota archaeon]